jgi:hypothetical protein
MVWALRLGWLYFILVLARGARRLRSFSITRGRGAWIFGEEQQGMWSVSLPRRFTFRRVFEL